VRSYPQVPRQSRLAKRCGPPLALTGVSYNVGDVKQFSSTPLHGLEKERHFALLEKVPYPTKARS
jgi:hypothetical protein